MSVGYSTAPSLVVAVPFTSTGYLEQETRPTPVSTQRVRRVKRRPKSLQILDRVQCFSVVLANSRVSIAGSSCATLRLLGPSPCKLGREAPTPFNFS